MLCNGRFYWKLLNVGHRVLHWSSLVCGRIMSASFIWLWAHTFTCRLNADADSVLTLLSCLASIDESSQAMVSIKIRYISNQLTNIFTTSIISSAQWDRVDGRTSFNSCWNTWKNSCWLHRKLDQVPRLHVNIFLSGPGSAQGPLHHVTFLHRKKDGGIFYPSRDRSLWKTHLFSL